MKLLKTKYLRLNRNHKFLLKAAIYFVAVYVITVQMLIFTLDFFVGQQTRKQKQKKRNGKKKTRQGKSKRTKYGTKASKKYYKKKYRGQG